MRCLQDPDYAERGVGRHTLGLLEHAASLDGPLLVGLIDERLPPVKAKARDVLHGVIRDAYAAEIVAGSTVRCFVSPSPMTHDPLWTARLMASQRWLRVSVVHDFIPQRAPDRYLPRPADRLDYAARLHWLAKSDVFLANSYATSRDLLALLGAPANRVIVTGCSVHPMFESVRHDGHARGRHILFVGGGDPRKNPETVVRAHARCRVLQDGAGVPLVVGGSYDVAEAVRLRAIAVEAGGRPDLVEVLGRATDRELAEMYASAIVLVCASRDEGFSIPVTEGMAAGVVCVASDIAAHRELVDDPRLRFAPDDPAALSALLERVVGDTGLRQAVIARQDAIWPRFRMAEVGRRFWEPVLAHVATRAPAILRGLRPSVAMLAPLPPARSGVADYTAATCGEIGKLVDLHLFTETEDAARVPGAATQRPLSALPHLLPRFDRVISVVGNSHFHLRIFELMRRYGAACIAHDARMLGFYRILLGLERALSVASRELGRPVTEGELSGWMADEGTLPALFLGEIAESASPMIVHSPVTAQLVKERHGVAAAHVPFCIYRPWAPAELMPHARAAARARLGLGPQEIAIATFGFVDKVKAPEECVWALDILRGWGLPARLHFVGADDPGENGGALRALVKRLRLDDHVRFAPSGYISENVYRDYLAGADLGIQLRTYGFGGLSGALMDCAAAGLPTVANTALARACDTPASYVHSIPDSISPVLLAEALADLLEAELNLRRPEEERAAFSDRRSLARYAADLCGALELDVGNPSRDAAAA
jgi:glycosyltransferase involved in cell wall biosynthesis